MLDKHSNNLEPSGIPSAEQQECLGTLDQLRKMFGGKLAFVQLLIATGCIQPAQNTVNQESELAIMDTVAPNFLEHEVRHGDTLWSLSKKYGVTVDELKNINSLDSDLIKVGQILKIRAQNDKNDVKQYTYEKTPYVMASRKGFYISLVANHEYNKYLKEEVEITSQDVVEEVVIDFNRRYNPELKDLNDECTNIPAGAKILVPNVQYFVDYFASQLDVPKESTKTPESSRKTQEGGIELDNKTPGQYVKKVGGRWVRDLSEMQKGAEKFQVNSWSQHPKWDDSHLKNRTLLGGRSKLKDVKFIILHSTISSSSNDTIKNHKAHFVVERDGSIKYLAPVNKEADAKNKVPPHAGISRWGGVEGLNEHSIGIEVVAKEKQDWTKEQINAVRELVNWLGGYYGLEKKDILTHYMVAKSSLGRGRKSDPYNSGNIFEALGLPDNLRILDTDVTSGDVEPNINAIKNPKYHHKAVWPGLEAASEMK